MDVLIDDFAGRVHNLKINTFSLHNWLEYILSIDSISRYLNFVYFGVVNFFSLSVNRIEFFSDFVGILNLNFFVNSFRNGLNVGVVGDSVAWNIDWFVNNFVLVFSRKVYRSVVDYSFLSLYKHGFGFDILIQNSWLSNDSLFDWSLDSFSNISGLSCDSLGEYFGRSSYSFCYYSWLLLNLLNFSFIVSVEVLHLPSSCVSVVVSI